MSYTLNLTFDFGSLTGLTLNGRLYAADGSQTGSTITSGFVEIGNGVYSYLATIPDSHVGTFVAYKSTDATIKAAVSINPQESEYTPLDATGIRNAVGLSTASLDTQLAAIAGYIDTEVAGLVTSVAALPSAASIADQMLSRNLAGSTDGGRTVRDALRASRNKVAFNVPATGQFTVYAEDDTTPAWTGTFTTTAGAAPIRGVDPA